MLSLIFNAIYTFFKNLVTAGLTWIGEFFSSAFQKLIDFFKILLQPIFIVVALLFYFIYKLGILLGLLFQVFLGIGKIVFSLVAGITKTIAGFSYAPSGGVGGTWGSIFGNIAEHGLSFLQIDIFAYILLFGIWFGTAFSAISIMSSIRSS